MNDNEYAQVLDREINQNKKTGFIPATMLTITLNLSDSRDRHGVKGQT
jgi:hypothetical protein